MAAFDSQDGLFDCAWSENSESHLLSASGDGSVCSRLDSVLLLSGILHQVKLWELRSNMNPLRSYNEHKAEVYSVDWNPVSKELFVSGSWDNTIKVSENACVCICRCLIPMTGLASIKDAIA